MLTELSATSSKLREGRKEAVAKAIGSWSFAAHEFSADELLFGALTMINAGARGVEIGDV